MVPIAITTASTVELKALIAPTGHSISIPSKMFQVTVPKASALEEAVSQNVMDFYILSESNRRNSQNKELALTSTALSGENSALAHTARSQNPSVLISERGVTD